MKIVIIGAGSFFTDAIIEELSESKIFANCEVVLVDTDSKRLQVSTERNLKIIDKSGSAISIKSTTDRKKALENSNYIITACEKLRVPYWIKDIEIPAKFGVNQFVGENGGPGGQAHAMRNISMFMDICKDIRDISPNARLMNFTNPMSFVCTYLDHFSEVDSLGFCHQVHGSFGVVAEMLGMEPGDLEIISAGVNHFNWLLDIRKRGSSISFMSDFTKMVKDNKYWQKNHKNIPKHRFTLDILENFGVYPIGYDDHICEYTPFFYDKSDWDKMNFDPQIISLKKDFDKLNKKQELSVEETHNLETSARAEYYNFPFPKDGHHPYYKEKTVHVMEAFETNSLLYLPSIVIKNNGSVKNLPDDALVDIPALAINGNVRGINIGELPIFAMELCRRQITIHEILTKATVEGDKQGIVQSMALDPYVKTIKQAVQITDAFLECYREELPQFWS